MVFNFRIDTNSFANRTRPETRFSVDGGIYDSPVNLEISASDENSKIYYSLDGSIPDTNSSLYGSAISINNTTVVRAAVFSDSLLPSKVVTNTYIINESFTFPVVSITTDPGNLWDPDSGIYVKGNNAESEYPYFGANFWQDWEKPAHVEMYEPSGEKAFSEDCGIKIFGGFSRAHPQKSLAVFFRKKYGKKSISYKLFPEKQISKFKSFILRNSGDDWSVTMFHDAVLQKIVEGLDLETQSYRPAIVFLNGELWGIQNIREKINEDYLEEHFGVDSKNIDLLENEFIVLEGNADDYLDLYNFISANDLSVTGNYEAVKSRIDIKNFIDYQISEIYFDNTDWPGNNMKYWRDNVHNSKWRWILFDTDYSFGFVNPDDYKHNTLAFALEPNGPDWPNPPWATLFLRKLIQNTDFKNEFINRYADYANTIFQPDNVLDLIDEFKQRLEPEIDVQINRWQSFTRESWENDIGVMKNFAAQRLGYLTNYFMSEFNLKGRFTLTVSNNQPSAGSVKINLITLDEFPWTGEYFINIPLKLKAIPKPGYKFVEWSGDISFQAPEIIINPEENINVTAVFAAGGSSNRVVINEINYNSDSTFNPEDWVELFNNTDSDIDLAGWEFKDEKDTHVYKIPESTILKAGEYIVLVREPDLFSQSFPDVQNYIGPFDFGLSGGGEKIRLYDDAMNVIDSLTYDDKLPWPEEADGEGKSLELYNPDRDNALPENWHASATEHGTPGKQNSVFTSVQQEKNQIPEGFSLLQNYPNPFNPSTTITYTIPASEALQATSHQLVQLKIYDILGREVATLVNEKQSPGTHVVEFIADDLTSGVYLYRLKSGGFIQNRKMILLK